MSSAGSLDLRYLSTLACQCQVFSLGDLHLTVRGSITNLAVIWKVPAKATWKEGRTKQAQLKKDRHAMAARCPLQVRVSTVLGSGCFGSGPVDLQTQYCVFVLGIVIIAGLDQLDDLDRLPFNKPFAAPPLFKG